MEGVGGGEEILERFARGGTSQKGPVEKGNRQAFWFQTFIALDPGKPKKKNKGNEQSKIKPD